MEPPRSANWFQAPLAADAALAEPLRRALGGREAVRLAVRSLLIRRSLTESEVAALTVARVDVLDLARAFTRLEVELPAPGVVPRPEAPRPGPRQATDVSVQTLRVMTRAMGPTVQKIADLAALADGATVARTLGGCIAKALADEVFPLHGEPDPNRPHRELVAAILGARALEAELLTPLNALDRLLVARRLEERQALMLTVSPTGQALRLGRIVRTACEWLRRTPPGPAEELAIALRA